MHIRAASNAVFSHLCSVLVPICSCRSGVPTRGTMHTWQLQPASLCLLHLLLLGAKSLAFLANRILLVLGFCFFSAAVTLAVGLTGVLLLPFATVSLPTSARFWAELMLLVWFLQANDTLWFCHTLQFMHAHLDSSIAVLHTTRSQAAGWVCI